MKKELEAYTDIDNPPFPPKGKIAQWDGTQWQIIDAPKPIPAKPADIEGGKWEYNGDKWVYEKYPDPVPYTELELAQKYIKESAWIAIDGIIDLFKNAAEIKAARAAAIEILKAHKAELSIETPKFD